MNDLIKTDVFLCTGKNKQATIMANSEEEARQVFGYLYVDKTNVEIINMKVLKEYAKMC